MFVPENRILGILSFWLILVGGLSHAREHTVFLENGELGIPYRIEEVARHLVVPWDLEFLPGRPYSKIRYRGTHMGNLRLEEIGPPRGWR